MSFNRTVHFLFIFFNFYWLSSQKTPVKSELETEDLKPNYRTVKYISCLKDINTVSVFHGYLLTGRKYSRATLVLHNNLALNVLKTLITL